ncbi:MAG: uracil-DNA glycosylase [Denitrovibrio sp.]|nr:MAG: uracil-DNA glycosylase [Denitrovibrio sp.]
MHYYVTWDETFPHGCRAYEFKSPAMPSVSVYKSSGLECQLFVDNPKIKKS